MVSVHCKLTWENSRNFFVCVCCGLIVFIGHKYYGIKRRRLFIDSIDNIVYNINNNYEKYKNKILSIIQNNNIDQFSIELLMKPSIIMSMFGYEGDEDCDILLLFHIGLQEESNKAISLFIDCLFHFNDIFLSDRERDKKFSFLKRYLNFENCKPPIIDYYSFVKYKIINLLILIWVCMWLCVYI